MSVIEVLEKFDGKHVEVPGDDKAGWKRLIHGAMSKAAGVLWTAGGTMDVSLGPENEEKGLVFTEMRSPQSDDYLTASLDSTEDLFVSFDDSTSIKVTSPSEGVDSQPESHSTPYKEKGVKIDREKVRKITGKEDSQASSKIIPSRIMLSDSGALPPRSPDLSELCSEFERLSLKKIISEVEKSLAEDIKDEFDTIRKRIDDHNEKVEEELVRDKDEKEVEKELTEMNWFQRVRESQLQMEQNFNSNLEVILAKLKKNENTLKSVGKISLIKTDGDKTTELEVVARKRALIESIGITQKSYNSKYNDLLHLLQSSRVSLVTEFHTEFDSLKRNNILLNDIISKSKCGNVCESDVNQCNQLLGSLSDMFDNIKLRNEEYERAMRMQDEANAKLNDALKKNRENSEAQKSEEIKPPNENQEDSHQEADISKKITTESSSDCCKRRLKRLKYYKYVTKTLKKAENALEQFLNDDKYKTFRKDCQRAVNVPVNAISPTSAQHLQDKLHKLMDLLDGKSVPVMSRRFTANAHPMGIKYCEILLARKIVKVGEDVVSSHPETGHAVASVVICLIMRYPVLAVYLHAYFFEVCPYLVPLDLQSLGNETDEQYNKRLGFTYEGGEREETDKFLKRMSGVAQLYGALLITNKRRSDSSLTPPLGISELWMWITNFISLEPLSDISATLLLDLLEVAGHFMLSSYQYNFQKLLYLICTDYLGKIQRVTTKGRGGPVERLKTFLEDVIKVKSIPPPKGLLPSHFW